MKKIIILAFLFLFASCFLFADDKAEDYSIFEGKSVTICYTMQDGGSSIETLEGEVISVLDSGLLIRTSGRNSNLILFRYKYILYIETEQ